MALFRVWMERKGSTPKTDTYVTGLRSEEPIDELQRTVDEVHPGWVLVAAEPLRSPSEAPLTTSSSDLDSK